MEIKNFIINILVDEEQLNNMLFMTSDLDSLSLSNREQFFEETFYNMSHDTVKSPNGTGRINCNTWDNIVFNVSSDDALIASSNFSRTAVESELTSVPQTMGEFIETQYQALLIS